MIDEYLQATLGALVRLRRLRLSSETVNIKSHHQRLTRREPVIHPSVEEKLAVVTRQPGCHRPATQS